MTRRETGKTPVRTILRRIFVWFSIPIWAFYLLFGFPWIPEIDELYPTPDGWVPATEWTRLTHIIGFFCIWYVGIFGATFVLYLLQHAILDSIWGHDESHRAWRQAGGDVFFDSLGPPFNFDSDEVREAIPFTEGPQESGGVDV